MRRLLLGKHFEYQVTATYSAYSISSVVQLIKSGYENNVKAMSIDGVLQPSVVSSYKFPKTGIHTVKYSLADSTTIGRNMFSGVTYLSSCTISEGVTTIEDGAFGNANNLTKLELPYTLSSIGNSAFTSCIRLSRINSTTTGECNIPNNVTVIGDDTFYNCYSFKNVITPTGLTSIGSHAFYNCSAMTTFNSATSGECNIPNTVLSIGLNAFRYTAFRKLIIPESVTSIGVNPWGGCSSLSSITVDNSNTTYDSRDNCNAVIETNTNTLIVGCRYTVIPNTVTKIGTYSFYSHSGLSSASIPTSVTSIESYAFAYCSGMTSITFEQTSQLTYIGSDAFIACYKLPSINIPNSVTSIGQSAFYNCSGLTKVNSSVLGECNIPNGVKSIYSEAFYRCRGLTSVNIPSSVTSVSASSWRACINISSITVDNGSTTYDSRDNCNAVIRKSNNELVLGCKDTVIPTSVTSIGTSAFTYCYSLTSISIPNSVTSINDYAFHTCSGLTSVTFEQVSQLTTIGASVFYNCSGLTSIDIPISVTTIKSYAFKYCVNLTSVNVSSGVTSIGRNPWSSCDKITSITVDSANAKYDSRNNCKAVINTSTNELIGGCKNTTIPNTVTSIGYEAFYHCSGLTSISIPNSVTSIDASAFGYCSGLTNVIIPASVTSIGNNVFYYASTLSSVTCMPTTPPTLGTNVFYSNASGRKIYVPSGSVDAYKTATNWSSYASTIQAIE